MSTQIKVATHEGLAMIYLDGRFDFNSQKEFRQAYSPLLLDNAVSELRIDCSKVTYIDSSALGMLMLLHERTAEVGKSVSLYRPNATVRKIFEIANFGKLFKIE